MSKINVTNSFLPPIDEYIAQLQTIWENRHLTNNGPLLNQFETQLKEYIDTDHLQVVSNGTIALQLALEALGIRDGEVITTPFSYVATVSSILWQRCEPVFVDIEEDTLNIDPSKIEAAITKKTRAIMPVHVFGNPCDTEAIEGIAKKHGLKVIYDAAHAFGVTYKGKPLLSYGDMSTVSFHATKAFHTIEGGAIISRDKNIDDRVNLIKRFGHYGDEHYMLGINAKANEFQAAMGLVCLPYFKENVEKRKALTREYNRLLGDKYKKPKNAGATDLNYTYYPIIFKTEDELLGAVKELAAIEVFPRRYFYPSLNTLPYLSTRQNCPVSERISKTILCLPLYADLDKAVVTKICEVLTRE